MQDLKYLLPRILLNELERCGYSQTELAQKAGIGKTVLHGWITGSAPRDIGAVARVAKVLDLPLYYLLFGVSDPVNKHMAPADLVVKSQTRN